LDAVYEPLISSVVRLKINIMNQKITPKGLEVERIVRDRLGGRFQKRFYTKRKDRTLIIGYRSNGEEIKHEFDLVAEDKSIIGEVKSDKYTKKAHSNTRLPRMLGACRYLELVKAKKKLFILTNKEMYEVIKHDLDGLINPDIEIIYFDAERNNFE